MKTTILFALVSILLSSCTKQIYQVTTFKYEGDLQGESPNTVDHGEITLTYNFWDEGGKLGFTIVNHTDKPIIIDFSQSSLIIQGENYPYFRNRSVTSFESTSEAFPINRLETAGTSQTQHDESKLFIAPQSEMYFEKLSLDLPRIQPQTVKPDQSVLVEMPKELEAYTFRHFMSYTIDGETRFLDDAFAVVSTELRGEIAFKRLNRVGIKENNLSSFHSLTVADNTSAVMGSAIVVFALIIFTVSN